MHEAHKRLLRYFEYGHLPEGAMRDTSREFCELAQRLLVNGNVADGAELTIALRKLLEAKDAAVRAVLTA